MRDALHRNVYKGTHSIVAGQKPFWSWTFYVTAATPRFEHHGRADTREAAKADVERNWEAWLTAAGLAPPARN